MGKLTDQQILEKIEIAGGEKRVSVLDPDFLIILGLALVFDATDIIFEILGLFTVEIPKIISIPFDILTFAIVGGWIFMRTGQIAKSKKGQVDALKKTAKKQITKLQTQIAKGIGKPGKKALLKGIGSLVGEIIPLLGIFPFWTVSVISTLWEK